ncbi:MAG: CpsB/CapC family capsule biosynthesis tyrosine phosphatase [Campylobacterota bacterium]|nr:CpsB/CapC family capsule biosynthesis tyrosine phosphatase [Campylobacterota bacterium]
MLEKMPESLLYALSRRYPLKHTVDLHSHLIPNIDDGLQSLEESIAIINQLKVIGFKKIITTPHIMSHRFPNTKETINAGYQLVKKELIKRNIEIEIEYAAEYYYDTYFMGNIEKKELLTFGDNYVLFELSYASKPFMLEETVAKMIDAGYKPILAHPERYSYYSSDADYRRLKAMGLYLQININSTQGFYGKKVKKSVDKIVNLGIVDFVGSDLHSQRYMDSFYKSLQCEYYSEIFKKNEIKNSYL